MYKNENLNIKKSDIPGEIPNLSDFENDEIICYNSDGSIYQKVPVVIYDVKKTHHLIPIQPVQLNASLNSYEILPGQKINLTWSSENAIKVYLNDNLIPLSGNLDLEPNDDITYNLKAVNGDDIKIVSLKVNVLNLPTGNISIENDNIIIGETTKLTWNSNNATIVKLNDDTVDLNGELNINPNITTSYKLDVINEDGQNSYNITCNVIIPLPILNISVNNNDIQIGESSTITWTTNYADSVIFSDGTNNINLELNGNIDVTPNTTTTYNFTASNSTGNIFSNITINVIDEWRRTDSTGDPDIIIDGNKVVYIDPTYNGIEYAGTLDKPFNSWSQIKRVANTTYLFKRGTTLNVLNGLGGFLNISNISFGAYGIGDRPKIICNSTSNSYYLIDVRFYNNPDLQQSSSTRISGLDISAVNPTLSNGIRGGSNLLIDNCYIHNTTWAWRSTSSPQGNPSRIKNIKMFNCVIESTQDDGIFIQNADDITIDKVLIVKANQNYHTVGHLQTQASGDGIQINAATKVKITNCKIDRSDTGCKFCIIIAGLFEDDNNYLIIDNNELISPIYTNQGGAVVYINDIRDNISIKFNNNKLKGDKGLTGLWYQSKGELNSINNVYDTLSNGIYNLNTSGSICTSENDTFINCSNNTRGNVSII